MPRAVDEGLAKVRSDNLLRLIVAKAHGNNAEFAAMVGMGTNNVNLMLTENPQWRRSLGEGNARRIEERLGLPHGYMDKVHTGRVGEEPVPVEQTRARLPSVLRTDEAFAGVTLDPRYMKQHKVTSAANLAICQLAVDDLAPHLPAGTHVIVDFGVKAITDDGIYLVSSHGGEDFIRRMRRLTTGYRVTGGPNVTAEDLASLTGLRIVGRVVASFGLSPH